MKRTKRVQKLFAGLLTLVLLFSTLSQGVMAFGAESGEDYSAEQAVEQQSEPTSPISESQGIVPDTTVSQEDGSDDSTPVSNTAIERSTEADNVTESATLQETETLTQLESAAETVTDVGSLSLNTEEITGNAAANGVEVSVSAPTGSFSDGTTVKITVLEETEKKTAFDITFTDASGNRVQPENGKEVALRFTVKESSPLLPEEGQNTKLSVYHRNDDGTYEEMKSVVTGDAAELEIKATHFSEYGVMSEEISLPRSGGESRVASSTDLSEFLTDVVINAPIDENGNHIINPNNSYELTFSFRENENLQFDDEAVLTYTFPAGVLMSDIGATAFAINIVDENGSATISRNTFEVVNGQLRVRLNQSDPNFERLKALSNVSINISVSSKFDQNVGEISFNTNVIKDFVFEENADLAITKRVEYDKDTDTANYVLTVTSTGTNENVLIQDKITGTALTLNRDVAVTSSTSGIVTVTPDYNSVENGFALAIPKMTDGEVLTIRYSADVDYEKIVGTGTVAQTNNTATVSSNEVPDEKVAEASLVGKIVFRKLAKGKAGDPVSIGNNQYEVPWTIRVNADHKLEIGGKTIIDFVQSSSQPFMHYTGEGITVEVTFEDGTSENRIIPWADLRTTSNDKGMIRWEYDAPESDGKASYLITYKSIADTTGVPGESLTVRNRAQVGSDISDASATIGIIGDDHLTANKEAINSTSQESTWQITVHVLKEGYPDLKVVDDLPKLQRGSTYYFDELIEDSIQIEGLLPGESWKLTKNFYASGRTIHFDFYQDEAQTVTGLKATEGGQPRDIIITFKTTVNQDWLNIAAQSGYTSNHLHKNSITARVSGYQQGASAQVFPKKQVFRKGLVESGSAAIDGVTYPVYRYVLTLENSCDDTASISDAFDTAYLKYYTGESIQIFGGTESEQNDSDGEISASDTATGIDIQVNRFPKDADGKFYPVYKIYYSLIVKDRDALDALNHAATQNPNGHTLGNTAIWNQLTSDTVEVVHTYYPYVDKELLSRPNAENGQVAEFKVIINQYADDLDPASDTLAIQDVLSSNLRFIPGSLSISPANDSIRVEHDSETNTLTFTEVPDETRFEITYQARVLGTGNVTYSNTVKFGQFEKTIEENTEIDSSGGGTGSNPSITLIKRDKDDLSMILAGATFQLYYMENGNRVPVTDKNGDNVTFTTGADGTALLIGNQQSLGWALWTDRTYCLIETVAPAGYEISDEPIHFILSENPSSQMEYDITGDSLSIQNEPVKISISVMKKWVGPTGNEVLIHLLADGVNTGKTVTLSADGNWTGSFEDLRKYHPDGSEIVYTVQEDPIENYQSVVTGDASDGFTVTNTSTATISIPVTKQWIGTPAEKAVIELLADGEVADQTELDEAGGWTYTFTGLPKYDSMDGHEIVYTLSEVTIPGYNAVITGDAENGFTVTNTITGKVSVGVTKQWIGPATDSVTVRLMNGDTEVASQVLNEGNNWQYTFTDLEKYNSEGQEITYTVEEVTLDGYSSVITGDMTSGFTVTNTNTEKISIPVTKQWIGAPLKEVTIHLLADGVEKQTATITAESDWKHTFSDLPKYDSTDGHEILYTVSESTVEGYSTAISGTSADGFTITNTITGRISIPVTKVWKGTALDSVTIRLFADGKEIDSHILNKENGWQYTFTDLEKYSNGTVIKYEIKEDKTEGYTTVITGDSQKGFTVTNTKNETPDKPTPENPTPGKTTTSPKTGDNSNITFYAALMLISAGLFILLFTRRKKYEKKQ